MSVNKAKIQERAEKLVSQGKIQAALDEYRALLKEQPDDLNTINRLGDLLVRKGKIGPATEMFCQGAALYVKGGFFLKAIAIYKKILKLDPAVIEPRLKLADLYARRDLTGEARTEYLAVAERLVGDRNMVRAREVYEKLIRIEPTNVQARNALADIHLGNGDTARALAELTGAARDLESLGMTRECVAMHMRILALPEPGRDACAEAVRALARLGETEIAIAEARRLYQAHGEELGPLEVLVEALELAGKPEEAEDLVKRELVDSAEAAIPRVVLGRLHARAGRLEAAIPLLLGAARDLQQQGRLRESAGALDTLLALTPSSQEALEQRLDIARTLGDTETASRLSAILADLFDQSSLEEKTAQEIPENPSEEAGKPVLTAGSGIGGRPFTRDEKDFLNEHMTEAEVFVKYGLLDKAIDPLQTVLNRFPNHLEAHMRLKAIYTEKGSLQRVVEQCLSIADLYERAGRHEEAAKILGEARNLDPDNAVVQVWLDRLSGGQAGPDGPRGPGAFESREEELSFVEVSRRSASGDVPAEQGVHAGMGGRARPPARAESASFAGLLDMSGEFGESFAGALEPEAPAPARPPEDEGDVQEVFKAFRQKVEQEVDREDYKTHYELAIAYKEMGLIDEAIAEFQHAAQDPSRFVECCTMTGMCFREKGTPSEAEPWYLEAIHSNSEGVDRELGLRFELAETYLEMGELSKAREAFRHVAGIDGGYRNVTARLEQVGKVMRERR